MSLKVPVEGTTETLMSVDEIISVMGISEETLMSLDKNISDFLAIKSTKVLKKKRKELQGQHMFRFREMYIHLLLSF